MKSRWLMSLVALALVIAACGGNGGDPTTTTAGDTTTTEGGGDTTTTEGPSELQYDVGVTPAPCDDALNDGNGCIYLGIISDLTDGPFAALGVPLTAAQRHFWEAVNEHGGIDGFDVIISDENVIDAHYRAADHAAGYETIRGRVLALAQSLGTAATQGILERMAEDNVVAAPAAWWSGYNFEEEGGDLILESGAPYCFEAMNGVTFMSQAMPEGFTWAMIRFPTDYGGDYGAGALIAASQLGLGEPLFDLNPLVPLSAGGTVDEAISLMLQHRPDLVVLVSGPLEMVQIAAGTFQGGHQAFQILGASPTWNVALKASEAMPLLEGVYKGTTPFPGWDTDSAGHAAIRAAAEAKWFDEAQQRGPSGAYLAGWTWQYPIKALLEEAVASGDLTRANVAAIAAELENIDYQGIIAERDYAGEPNDNVARFTYIMQADAESADGLTNISNGEFISPLVAEFPFDSPCYTE